MRTSLLSLILASVLCPNVAHATNVMAYSDKSGSARTNEPVQFGRVFAPGEIANYPQVLVDGSSVTTQSNVLSRWGDGSVKHAIISFLLASVSGNGSKTFTFQNQAGCNCGSGVRLTKTQMLDAAYDFDATVAVGSTTISARTILTAWDGTDKGTSVLPAFWADGLISTTVILGDHSSSASYDITVSSHPSLRPLFIATFWPTINKVKVRFVLENSNTLQLQDISYNALLKTGSASPATIYNSTSTWASGIPHIGATRWTKTAWIGGAPDDRYNLDHNLAYLIATKAIPNFDTTKTVSASQVAADYAAWTGGTTDIYQVHGANAYTWCSYMGTPGGRYDLGPFPAWYVRWLYTGDYRDRQIMLGNADLAAAYPVHIREGATGKFFDIAGAVPAQGRALSIAARPTVNIGNDFNQAYAVVGDVITPVGSITGVGEGEFVWQESHSVSAFFLPYIVTGDYFYLEQQRFWTAFSAAFPVASTEVNYGRGASLKSGMVYMGELRAIAWGLRERAEAAWMEPDGTPEKTLFGQWMASAIGILDGIHNITTSTYNGNADWNWGRSVMATHSYWTPDGNVPTIPGHSPMMHWWYGGGDGNGFCQANYGINPSVAQSCYSQYELSYLAYALGHAYELGFPTDKLISKAVGPWYVAMLTDAGANPYLISAGRIPTQKWTNSSFTSMADTLSAYQPDFASASTACGGCSFPIHRGLASVPLLSAEGYDVMGAAAVAMVAPLTANGAAAWNWARTNIESQAVYDTTSDPRWALVARDTTPVAPTITTTSLPNGTVGSAYSQTLAASGDTPISWTVVSGSLPAWVTLTESTGAITGTPDAAATTNFTVRATNSAGTDDQELSITVDAAAGARTVVTGSFTGTVR